MITVENDYEPIIYEQNYTNFDGEARAKKKHFFGRNFPKSASKRHRKFRQIEVFIEVIWESSENQFGRPNLVDLF